MKKFMVFSNNPGLSPLEVSEFSNTVDGRCVEFVGSYDECISFMNDSFDDSHNQCKYDYACGYVD